MKLKQSSLRVMIMAVVLATILAAGCKKSNNGPDKIEQKTDVPMPDSAMFVGTGNNDTTTIFLLNAANGSFVNKYSYRHNKHADSYIPLVGNGLLYVIENTKINALNMNTGAIMWSDSVKNATWMHSILHNDTFYGLSTTFFNDMTVYAMDATKQSNTFLWQYTLSNSYANTTTNITYFNGLVYINTGTLTSGNLTVLDAKTGTVKWALNAPCSVASLKNGLITSGNSLIDAATGVVTGTVASPLAVSNNTQTASIIYADKSSFFTRVIQFGANYTTTSKLNAYDAATNALKWSINGGSYSVGRDTVKSVDQILGNQPIIRTDIGTGVGIYGYTHSVTYSGLDLSTDTEKWSYQAGTRGQNFKVDNTMYSCGTFTLNLAAGQPATSTINAADLNTGKIKWAKNNLPFSIGGSVAACISVRGKGYSVDIQ